MPCRINKLDSIEGIRAVLPLEQHPVAAIYSKAFGKPFHFRQIKVVRNSQLRRAATGGVLPYIYTYPYGSRKIHAEAMNRNRWRYGAKKRERND